MLTKSTAGQLAGPTSDLQLINYGAGHAWLRADHVDLAVTRQFDRRGDQPSDAVRYTITQAGRDYLARERALHALFGRPWPTVAQACGLERLGAA